MDTSSIYPYKYFLPTQGINAEKGKIDLQRVFSRPGEACSIEVRSMNGRSGLYVRASLELSNEAIARLAGRTNTPLERLLKVETRLVTSDPSFAAASARRASFVAGSHTAGYQMQASSVSGPVSQSANEQFSTHNAASSHRRESDAEDRRVMAGTPRYLPDRPTDPPHRPAANMSSYSAVRYYDNDNSERGQDERTSPSGPHSISQNKPQNKVDDLSRDAAVYDARNDAFFFPPNSVSALEIERRREMMKGVRGAADL